jgi:Rrf2 family protein
MNVSVKSDYALLALFDLASQPPGEPIRIAEIARRQKIPQKFLELILAGLRQAGFVESRRGAEGGYLLARSPASFSVGDVLRAVEGANRRRLLRPCGGALTMPYPQWSITRRSPISCANGTRSKTASYPIGTFEDGRGKKNRKIWKSGRFWVVGVSAPAFRNGDS